MGPFVAHGLPRCDSPTQEEALLRFLRQEYRASGAAWVVNGTARQPAAALRVRAWLSAIVRPLRRPVPASPSVSAHGSVASVHFSEPASPRGIAMPTADLVAAAVLGIPTGSDSAAVCAQACEQ